ncbi:Syntaxin-binding protein 5 [Sesamum alatum]|uniref:Syntaxin-binding protein 5 n=1 Tax=Sesamum alatum TaxID=300844 RepID=A0AAE2CW04_9LAMI|nr:Syntaxin-binding protein 5 [Sesamum alatum]
MFAKLFSKSTQSQIATSSSQPDVAHESMASPDFAPRVAVHYGIPSNASILAFDRIQRLLAVGALDGKIKVVGGDNIEGLLISPKALPFKNLEFLQNQGFLVSVSNVNEIQVWDLEKRHLSSNLQWESNITTFAVISDTNFIYVGDEYGFLSVLKYEAEEANILQLQYHVPPNLIAEGAGILLPDHQSVVGVLSQPCSFGNRVLIAFENGLIILWDVTEDRAIHVRGSKDLQLKEHMVVNFSNNESHTYPNDSLDNEEAEKEISSLCWVSPDESVLAVGYVDGDILLWDLSVSDNGKVQRTQKPPNDVVKIQLSSGDKRLPVIVLRWSPNKAQNGSGGQLFAYGGGDIGSEEVLTILDLDWSSGLAKLKCIERVDLRLHGTFSDVLVISNAYKSENKMATSVFVLTNPGLLHFYEYASLSTLKPEKGKNNSVHAIQYHSVIPTVEPYMTVGELFMISSERNNFYALSETVAPAKQQSDMLTGRSTKWPLTGGVPYRISETECNTIKRIYIGGYQDGSVRIWDATFPVLSLISVLEFEIKGNEVVGANAPISALDLCSANLTLAIGNEFGVIFLYRFQGNSDQRTITIVTETKHEVHHYLPKERNACSTIFSILNSAVAALQFATSGIRLVAGFECGKVAVLDTSSPSVLFVTDCVSSLSSPVISVAVKSSPDNCENSVNNSDDGTGSESSTQIVFFLTRDAHMVLMDSTTGNMISSPPVLPKEKSIAISMYLLELKHPHPEGSRNDSIMSSQDIKAQSQSLQTDHQNESDLSKVGEAMQRTNLEHKTLPSQILLCCEDAFYFYPLKSLIQGDHDFVRKLKLEKPCSWTAICNRDTEKYGIIIVYQSGDIELRSLPELQLLGNTSMMSLLRWNFKNNMDKTMSSSDKGQITLVNGGEFAFVSLLAFENEFRLPESLPCLHDKALAAAADADVNFSQNQKKAQSGVPGFVSNMIKGLKGVKEEQGMDYKEAREILIAHLEKIFSRFPFSDLDNSYDLEDMELQIDDVDIDIDEPVLVVSSSEKSSDNVKAKENEREKLFEGGSSGVKPAVRTREEIIAKYRNTGDAAGAASEARNKLMERKEKLEKLSDHTAELQSGAENFSSLAHELAKNMEKRKWWNL